MGIFIKAIPGFMSADATPSIKKNKLTG